MKLIKRLLAIALSLLLVGLFYAFAVLMEGEDKRQSTQFVVEELAEPLTAITPVQSQDSKVLLERFGAAFPLPEGFTLGQVENGSYHGYQTRRITLQGKQALVTGIRPSSAAAQLAPKDAQFESTIRALLGYPLMIAQVDGYDAYSLITPDAAFLIQVPSGSQPGAFDLIQAR
ncbi:MAG: hypothetical protein GX171_09790 [Clostridiales bacterium]|jgi:hypothetical protein|nr:hypothetical protein [Clostridiales bacterium]